MKFESAELSKIAINAFLVSTVTTTNILSMISEKINADWNDIVPALKKDSSFFCHGMNYFFYHASVIFKIPNHFFFNFAIVTHGNRFFSEK